MSPPKYSSEDIPAVSRSGSRVSADIGVSGREEIKTGNIAVSSTPYSTRTSYDEPPSGAQTPTPLLVSHRNAAQKNGVIHTGEETYTMENLTRTRSHMGDALENLYQTQTARSQVEAGLEPTLEAGSPSSKGTRGRPKEFSSLTTELIFVLICSSGQLFFSFFQGNINVNQTAFREALGIKSSELPWLVGSYLVALGLSVILSGSLADLLPPRLVIIAAFIWLTIWNVVGVFSLTPTRSPLFFIMRAMQGLSVGVIVSGTMSILGRVYAPGLRKTRVFSAMSSMAPFGFFLGAIQGGALTAHLQWIFGSNAILSGLCAVAAYFTIPPLRPAADFVGADAPTIRDFDWKGAIFATSGCVCLLFGLTQGTVANWSPYTYSLIIVGATLLAIFFFVEHKVHRPLIPNSLWKTPGFAPLMAAYFLGFGGFLAYQFYSMQFFLNIQSKSALTVALYLLPNAIMGVLATFLVAKLLHKVPGHYIYMVSMVAFALGPALFLGNKPSTTYWALSMPAIALATFGPDMSFAAASIFITSNVPRSYQGSAGSLLVTIQNLSSAIMTSVGDSIASEVDTLPDGTIGLAGLRAAWWFALGSALVGAVITAVAVRIPKEVEKEHVT